MDIGNTHIDGSVLVVGVLVVSALLAVWMLRRRPEQPIESPAARAVRLVRKTRFGLQPGYLYFVENRSNEVLIVANMSYARRIYHPAGWLVRHHEGNVQVASVGRDEDPATVRDRRFIDYND